MKQTSFPRGHDPEEELLTLKDELKDAKRRYQNAGQYGRAVISEQIREIERDIESNIMKSRALLLKRDNIFTGQDILIP